MQSKYDVIICGAGPAGSTAAVQLRQKGLSVLLIDAKEFPRDKVCGDQLTPLTVQLLENLNLMDEQLLTATNKINKVRIVSPQNVHADVQLELSEDQPEIYIIPRKILDDHLVKHAEKSGANCHTGRVYAFEYTGNGILVKTHSNGKNFEFNGKMVIGADGSVSTIARLSKLTPAKNRGIAIRGYLSGIDLQPDRFEGYFDKKWFPGYAWLFPTSKNTANIGLGLNVKNYKFSKYKLDDLLNSFLKKDVIQSRLNDGYQIESIGTWPLNIGPPDWKQLVEDRIMLIGDAASLINPFTGGGIETAIISSGIASEIISQKMAAGDFSQKSLRDYSQQLKKQLSKELALSSFISKFIGLSPGIVELLVKSAKRSNLPFFFMKFIYKNLKFKRLVEN